MLEHYNPNHAPAFNSALRPRVLLVDDCEHQRVYIALLVAELGLEVSATSSGLECVGAFRHAEQTGEPYDCVLLDLNMPKIDGYKTAEELRSGGAQVPIIALTANSSLQSKNQAIHSGCDTFLAKKTLKETLLPTFMRLLEEEF